MPNELTMQVGTRVVRTPIAGTVAVIVETLKDYAISISMPIPDGSTNEQIAQMVLDRIKEDIRLGARRVRIQRKLEETRKTEETNTTGDI